MAPVDPETGAPLDLGAPVQEPEVDASVMEPSAKEVKSAEI